ncbi:hypothetical protein LZP69_03875 [Shewanella sp. AS1]|uniref:hypothetical protein n=1 Tax=Shewanella sp. AS1 TaxID=2907626 RepID=UPI001F2BDBE7|nr:hypothetical protein [Shewanella sp. AS1]MCE9678335.1 hypothetical protein [Shewanella sp. AS1]
MRKAVVSCVYAAALAGFVMSAGASAEEGTRTGTKVASYNNSSDYKIGFAFDRGASFTAQLFNNINLSIGNKGFAGDYLFLTDEKFSPKLPFSWYLGVGGFYDWDKDNNCNDNCNGYGVRVPFGLDWNFASRWDTYVQVGPAVDIDDDFHIEVQGAIGIRFAL